MTKKIALIILLFSSLALAENKKPSVAEQANRLFIELEALTSGLQLRTGQLQSDGSASEGAQAVEVVTQGCEHKATEDKTTKVNALSGADCPVNYFNTVTIVSSKEGAGKVKIASRVIVTQEPLLMLMTVHDDNKTAEMNLVENDQMGLLTVTENHTIISTELKEVSLKRMVTITQDKLKGTQSLNISAVATGGLKLNVSLNLKITAENAEAVCKMDNKEAKCEDVAFILGINLQPESSQPGNKTPIIERALPYRNLLTIF